MLCDDDGGGGDCGDGMTALAAVARAEADARERHARLHAPHHDHVDARDGVHPQAAVQGRDSAPLVAARHPLGDIYRVRDRPKRRRANLGRPFFRPRPASDDDGSFAFPRTRLRSDRHPRLATRSSAARQGGDGRRTRAVSTRRSSPRSFFLLPRGEARRRRTPFSTLFANFF